MHARSALSVLAALLAAGCPTPTSGDAGPDPHEDAGAPGDGGPAEADAGPPQEPALAFFVNSRPHDDVVTWTPTEGPVRYSDPLRIVAKGLAPGDTVGLRTGCNGAASLGWFTVPGDGVIDTARDAPAEGTWTEVDVDGPIWSMALPRTPPTSFVLTLEVAVLDDEEAVIVERTLGRRYVNEGVITMSVDNGEMIGTLAFPEGDGPFPGILVFGGSEGGRFWGDFMAPYLAQLGYAAFGVAYFGEPGLESTLRAIPLERLEQDLAHLAAQPEVDEARLAVMGGSRGGELALLLGAHFDEVKAVVADVASGYVWGSTTVEDDAAWTLAGADVPWVPTSADAMFDVEYDSEGVPHYSGRDAFFVSIDDADPAALLAASIPVENTGGPILLNGGADDQVWPSCELIEVAWERLLAAGHTAAFSDEMTCYPGAGHSFHVPGLSTQDSTEYYQPAYQGYVRMGGTPAGNGAAERAANSRMRAFLEAALGPL